MSLFSFSKNSAEVQLDFCCRVCYLTHHVDYYQTKQEEAIIMWQSELKKESAYDAFISYSSKNKTIVDALCHYLEENKIRCWMAPRDIMPGQDYAEAIAQAMSKVKVFVLVYSNFSLSSQWVRKETNLAVSKKKIIIPFRIEDCSFEGTAMELYLNDRHWIDAVPEPAKSFGNVAEAITSLIGTKISTETATSQPQPETKMKSRKQTPADGESVIDSVLDHADACIVGQFLSAKAKEHFFWIATAITFILSIVFMSCNWENIGTGTFLLFLFFLPSGIFFTIKAFFYSRKLAFPFEIKYTDLKKVYSEKAYEMRKAAVDKRSSSNCNG